MGIKVNIKMNKAALGKLSATQLQALEMTAEAVKSEITNSGVVPKETGALERSAFVDTSELKKGKAAIRYDTPYARRLYWHPEYNFSADLNANAKGKWMQDYIDGDKKDFAKNAYKKVYRRLNRGVVK